MNNNMGLVELIHLHDNVAVQCTSQEEAYALRDLLIREGYNPEIARSKLNENWQYFQSATCYAINKFTITASSVTGCKGHGYSILQAKDYVVVGNVVESRPSETFFIRDPKTGINAYISIVPWMDPNCPNGFQLIIGSVYYGSYCCSWSHPGDQGWKKFLVRCDEEYVMEYLRDPASRSLKSFMKTMWPLFIRHIEAL